MNSTCHHLYWHTLIGYTSLGVSSDPNEIRTFWSILLQVKLKQKNRNENRLFATILVLVPALMRVLSFIQGEIPDLFPDDELENIIGSVRPEVRGSGLMDTRENCWKFFIDRVRRQLKVKQSHKCQTKCCLCSLLVCVWLLIIQKKVVVSGSF